MTDVQPDYTPFLNLVRPDLHDDVDTTVEKLRDAIDAIDAWAQAQSGSGGATALAQLSDVQVSGASANNFLLFDGSVWQPGDLFSLIEGVGYTFRGVGFADVADVAPNDQDVLTWEAGSGKWTPAAASGPLRIAGHDVVIGTLNDGDLIRFNASSGNWEDIGVYELGLSFAFATYVQPSQGPAALNDYTFGPAAFSVSPETPTVVLADATIQANMVLPAAADAFSPEYRSVVLTFKKVDATGNPVHITPQAGETIDGADHLDITTQWASRTLVTDGANWFVV